jgi:hypothetical protein
LFLLCCSSARCRHTFDRRHCGLVCHFKTDPTETVGLCFGYPKTPCLRAEGKLSSKQMNRSFVCWIRWLGITNKQYIWDFLLLQDFQCFNLYYYSVGCSARSLRSNHVPHRRCGRLYLDWKRHCYFGHLNFFIGKSRGYTYIYGTPSKVGRVVLSVIHSFLDL